MASAFEIWRNKLWILSCFSPLLCNWHEVLLLDNEIVFNEAIIDEMKQGIKEEQQQIDGVQEISKGLAALVHNQGTQICKLMQPPAMWNHPCASCWFLAQAIYTNIKNFHAATAHGKIQLSKVAKTQVKFISGKLHLIQCFWYPLVDECNCFFSSFLIFFYRHSCSWRFLGLSCSSWPYSS